MIHNETQTAAAAAELRRRYSMEWHGVLGGLTAIEQRLTEEFPAPDGDAPVTRYDLDAVRALRCELSALLERG
jgi:hypothetical protein